MRSEMNSNWYEISFRLKISLRCSVSPLLVFTWIEAKWNSNWYGFHIGHFDRNEISNRHEIFMWTWTAESLWMLHLMRMCVWNSMLVWISYRSFWQKWNLISCDKISCKDCPKWNACTCPSKHWVVLKCSRNGTELHVNRTCFHAGLKSQTGMSSFRLSCERSLSLQ